MSDRRYPRMARVNEVVREVVAEELEAMSDPRLELVTVTGVDVSPDLKSARVYYSALDPDFTRAEGEGEEAKGEQEVEQRQEASAETAEALEAARRHLQAALGRQVRLKYVPKLTFVSDPAVERGRRIEDIIRHLHEDEP